MLLFVFDRDPVHTFQPWDARRIQPHDLLNLVYLLLAGIDPRIVIQKMVMGPDSFLLLAVPFFILAARIMNSTGVTKRIFRFASTIVGHG